MQKLKSLNEAISFVTHLFPDDLKIGAPLGLGKANQLVNLIYEKYKSDPSKKLEIYSALSLDVPEPKSELERRLLTPFLNRHFGEDYPRLSYVKDLQQRQIPDNIQVHEFYFLAGQFINNLKAQKNYISLNYTHAARGIYRRGLQVLIQLVARRGNEYSLSCNPDMTLDLVDIYKEQNKKLHIIAVVHPDLPFLGGDAIVNENFFDAIVETTEVQHELFALPRNPVDQTDHMIGLHASRLVEDDGTLQIGIGSLSDALVHWMIQRHQKNKEYKKIIEKLSRPTASVYDSVFDEGLYGTSEMIMDGFMYLRQAGILKRTIFDLDEQKKRYLHGAFFLGSKNLYAWLRQLKDQDFDGLSMTRVSKVNDLYDSHEKALRRQRQKARFFNTCMQVDLLGGASSDTLENGQVISGVGGQYNFVSMSQELPDSRSILMVRSTRFKNGQRLSNIVTSTAQITVPRHLRDIIVTEYGIADLRGKTDSEVIQALINISDRQFQPQLLEWAIKNNKLPSDYEIPAAHTQNNPVTLKNFIKNHSGFFPEAPFGLDFTETEFKLIKALTKFKKASKIKMISSLFAAVFISSQRYKAELQHLKLEKVSHLKDFFMRLVVKAALKE